MEDSTYIRMVETFPEKRKKRIRRKANLNQKNHPKKTNGCVKTAEILFLIQLYINQFLKINDVHSAAANVLQKI